MTLHDDTYEYWKLSKTAVALGVHRSAGSPIHLQMRNIADRTSGAKLRSVIQKTYGGTQAAQMKGSG